MWVKGIERDEEGLGQSNLQGGNVFVWGLLQRFALALVSQWYAMSFGQVEQVVDSTHSC